MKRVYSSIVIILLLLHVVLPIGTSMAATTDSNILLTSGNVIITKETTIDRCNFTVWL